MSQPQRTDVEKILKLIDTASVCVLGLAVGVVLAAVLLALGSWPFREFAMIPVGFLIGFAVARLELAVRAILASFSRPPQVDDDLA